MKNRSRKMCLKSQLDLHVHVSNGKKSRKDLFPYADVEKSENCKFNEAISVELIKEGDKNFDFTLA